MRSFIISDTHFDHQFLEDSKLRPKEIKGKIIKNWNLLVNHEDLVIHLGDFLIGNSNDYFDILPKLKGRKILIIGNHDKKGIMWYMKNGFDFACDSFSWQYMGKLILFSHEPSEYMEQFDFNIHGHLHIGLHRNEYELTEKHLLFSLEKENYQPVLLKTFLAKYSVNH